MKPSGFSRFASRVAHLVGRPAAFIVAFAVILLWALSGPIFHFSDTWQLVVNTGTTVVTFLMVFLIQNTQNRDTAALHVKLDELIRVLKGARTELMDLEELDEKQLDAERHTYETLARHAREVAEQDETQG